MDACLLIHAMPNYTVHYYLRYVPTSIGSKGLYETIAPWVRVQPHFRYYKYNYKYTSS